MSVLAPATFDPALRRERHRLFALERTTGGGTIPLAFGEETRRVYRNANFSIYSGQRCNARCPFCVEELRPLARGIRLEDQRRTLPEDARYFAKLEAALAAVAPLDPSVSITGGEASIDPRLPGILERVARAGSRKRTLTTNASGLLARLPDGRLTVEAIADAGLEHLNVSRASPDEARNQAIMQIGSGETSNAALARAVAIAEERGVSVRLSCVLLRGVTETREDLLAYVAWARSLGVRNVIFRQLMQHDPERALEGPVTRYSDARRVNLWALLETLRSEAGGDARFRLVRQILGYYYYVEVYELGDEPDPVSVVFEGADLAEIRRERERAAAAGDSDVVHELVFHPGGTLNSTWQPWDGVLLP